MTTTNYDVTNTSGVPIKSWTRGVPVEDAARAQLANIAGLPFVHKWVAAMPDVHLGKGATVGSVIPTKGAIIPAAVGVDIGCGMMAMQISLGASHLPDNLRAIRHAIERHVPHGRSANGGRGDRGAWGRVPKPVDAAWTSLAEDFARIADKHPKVAHANHVS
ncbi:MAG TPA: RtcB family protein, partial [Kofleriaceae bacterium]|nr:RtcB family protein [Kofleriaceae bacterium]